MDEAYERKHLRYAELVAEAKHCGWNTEVRPVEVGCFPGVRFRGKIYHQTAWRLGNQGPESALSHQSYVGGSRDKQPVAMDEEARPLLGPKVAEAYEVCGQL